jgi:hypothetical protein
MRLVFPRPLDRGYGDYVRVVHEELETPLHTATVSELKCKLEHRRKAETERSDSGQAFLDRGAGVFDAAIRAAASALQQHGDVVFDDASSPSSPRRSPLDRAASSAWFSSFVSSSFTPGWPCPFDAFEG